VVHHCQSGQPVSTRASPLWLTLLTPKAQLESAFEITPTWLQDRNLKGLALDIDNTLAPTHLPGNEAQIRAWLEPFRQAKIPIRIVSNGHSKRILEFCQLFKLEFVGILGSRMAAKPIPSAFNRAIQELGLPANQIAMVGDQIFTDMLGANMAGMYTVLVKPLTERSMPHTKLIRNLERLVLAKLEREKS
jgi:uncharacterized protein